MGEVIETLLQQPEAEEFEAKSKLDVRNPADLLGLVADLVAMANTKGGRILIGKRGNPFQNASFIDSARLDDQVNRFIEPRIGGIRSSEVDCDFVLVDVEKSQSPPHVFKRDGNYQNSEGRQSFLFRVGDILVRHSSKTERANRSDFERWFEERRRQLFENVKLVFDASQGSRIQLVEGPAVPVRIDPSAPGAQPVYDVLTPEPFRDFHQELMGALKAWKASKQFLNEAQIFKAYQNRASVSDPDLLELILRSCWEQRLPGYFWAARLGLDLLVRVLEDVMKKDSYPAANEALKVASLLPRTTAKSLTDLATNSKKRSIRTVRKKLDPVFRANKKHAALLRTLHPGKRLRYKIDEAIKEVRLPLIDENTMDELLNSLMAGIKENRYTFKASELCVFGGSLAEIQAEREASTEAASEP